MVLEGSLELTQTGICHAGITRHFSEHPAILEFAKNSVGLVEKRQGLAPVASVGIRNGCITQGVALAGTVCYLPCQRQRLFVIFDRLPVVSEIILYSAEGIESS